LETRTYLTKARSTYAAWGASAKVGQLDERYADFLKTRADAAATPTSAMSLVAHTGTDSPLVFQPASALDLSTVMATARALSEEVALENVVERVLVSAIENAGANRGLLLLAEDGALLLEAECAVDGNYRRYRPSLPIEDCTARLPVSVVRFVTRTAETVVLGDASHRGMFTGDSYVAGTGSRSILCVPILKRTKLVGVLYLENTLVARAFTDERLSVLRLVAAQAAISLENARLIEELRRARDGLEQRVDERTQELVALQDDLVAAARRAGMAEVATGVLHNVGNILNSVNTSVADLEEVLRYSRLPSLERTLELLGEHQDDLGAFLSSDPRGQLVPEFLRLVSEQLGTEHHRMREDVAQLSQNVEHVRHVISAQQAFAGVSGVVEELVITELIDEAIRICGATRPWRDQRIVREIEEVPPLQLQRHQVLQILVNLIANARDALDDQVDAGDLRIIIGAKRMDDRVHISVRDFGVGIAPENLDRVFNHGFTTKKTGHGFGLHSSAIAARQIVGELRVESDGPTRGATFILELPISQSFQSGRERLPRTRHGPGTR
ncbi:MAG: GAF domain-containing protein, partial [Deltaproteobacteria bacterium]|nr:GAF domain-containing protein [Deltaproteobacteria bacterium]